MRALFLALLLTAPFAHAQKKGSDEGAIPYPEDESQDERNRRELPKKSDASPNIREETDVESQDREKSMAHLDDPSIGLGLEMLIGAMLLDSTRGTPVDIQLMGGIRFTWEWSRTLFSDEFLREYFFADVTWSRTQNTYGTAEVFSNSTNDFFTFAPAFSFPFGHKSPISVYAQAGIGFAFNSASLTIDATSQSISGAKILIQYGGGIRGRPLVVEFDGGALRISFRIEVTRFRRAYMDDTYLGAGVGVTF